MNQLQVRYREHLRLAEDYAAQQREVDELDAELNATFRSFKPPTAENVYGKPSASAA